MLLPKGITQATLPLPFDLGSVNVYLLRRGTGFVLVDTGMDTIPGFAALDRARRDFGCEWRDLQELVLTHHHPDHVGMAPRILALSGDARLRISTPESKRLSWLCDGNQAESWERNVLLAAGVPSDRVEEIALAMRPLRDSFHPLRASLDTSAGSVIPSDLGDFELLMTPGHSPAHICLHNRQHRILISGDHMIEKTSPHIPWHPEEHALQDYLESLRRTRALELDFIAPAHGAAFTGHREWIDRAITKHHERCELIRATLAENPVTPYELCRLLWPRPLPAFHLRFAIFETLSHLQYVQETAK